MCDWASQHLAELSLVHEVELLVGEEFHFPSVEKQQCKWLMTRIDLERLLTKNNVQKWLVWPATWHLSSSVLCGFASHCPHLADVEPLQNIHKHCRRLQKYNHFSQVQPPKMPQIQIQTKEAALSFILKCIVFFSTLLSGDQILYLERLVWHQ